MSKKSSLKFITVTLLTDLKTVISKLFQVAMPMKNSIHFGRKPASICMADNEDKCLVLRDKLS